MGILEEMRIEEEVEEENEEAAGTIREDTKEEGVLKKFARRSIHTQRFFRKNL